MKLTSAAVSTLQRSAFWGALLSTQPPIGFWVNREQNTASDRAREHPAKTESGDGGLPIALGALLDGIPESIVVGVSMISGGAVSWVTVAAIFLSNIPEGLSSAAGMKKAGRSIGYIFGVWGAIALISGISALLGYTLFSHFSGEVIAATTAVAAGSILATISDTMIPEAFEETHDFAGLITVCGFLAAFVLSKLGER